MIIRTRRREYGTPFGDFLARKLDKLAQLVDPTRATPEQHDSVQPRGTNECVMEAAHDYVNATLTIDFHPSQLGVPDMHRDKPKPHRHPRGYKLDGPAESTNEAPQSMPRGFVTTDGIYIPSDAESAWWTQIQDERDRRELNPQKYPSKATSALPTELTLPAGRSPEGGGGSRASGLRSTFPTALRRGGTIPRAIARFWVI